MSTFVLFGEVNTTNSRDVLINNSINFRESIGKGWRGRIITAV